MLSKEVAPERLEEMQWAVNAQNGDMQGFTNLMERYQRAVYNLCYRMLGNPNDAEDAAQETFLRAYRAIARYDVKRKFSTWTLSIATNYCIDQLRKRRMIVLSMDEMPYLDVSEKGPGPEQRMMTDERSAQVSALLDSLGHKDRAAVVMRYWYDFSYDEIADVLKLTNSAVKSRLHRARRTLAKVWAAENPQAAPEQSMLYESQTI